MKMDTAVRIAELIADLNTLSDTHKRIYEHQNQSVVYIETPSGDLIPTGLSVIEVLNKLEEKIVNRRSALGQLGIED